MHFELQVKEPGVTGRKDNRGKKTHTNIFVNTLPLGKAGKRLERVASRGQVAGRELSFLCQPRRKRADPRGPGASPPPVNSPWEGWESGYQHIVHLEGFQTHQLPNTHPHTHSFLFSYHAPACPQTSLHGYTNAGHLLAGKGRLITEG